MAKSIIVDTGYWLALFDPKDGYFSQAGPKSHYLESEHKIMFPWPTLYETLGTKFVKNSQGINNLQRLLKRQNILFIDDVAYRHNALDLTMQSAKRNRPISLCDMMIRLMLEDTNLRINAILTFNPKDFVDVCRSRRVEML